MNVTKFCTQYMTKLDFSLGSNKADAAGTIDRAAAATVTALVNIMIDGIVEISGENESNTAKA